MTVVIVVMMWLQKFGSNLPFILVIFWESIQGLHYGWQPCLEIMKGSFPYPDQSRILLVSVVQSDIKLRIAVVNSQCILYIGTPSSFFRPLLFEGRQEATSFDCMVDRSESCLFNARVCALCHLFQLFDFLHGTASIGRSPPKGQGRPRGPRLTRRGCVPPPRAR